MRPFLTMSSIHMTGKNLLSFIHSTDQMFSKYLPDLQPEIVSLYRQIIHLAESIGNNNTKHISSEFASKLRSLLCHYFTDVNEFHVQGLSGENNKSLKASYETIVARLTEIQKDMLLKGTP